VRGEGRESSPIDANLNVDIQALIWTGSAVTPGAEHRRDLDVFGGVRYLGLETSTDLSFSGRTRARTLGALRTRSTSGTGSSACAASASRRQRRLVPAVLPRHRAGNYSNWTWQGWAGGYRFDWAMCIGVPQSLLRNNRDESIEDCAWPARTGCYVPLVASALSPVWKF